MTRQIITSKQVAELFSHINTNPDNYFSFKSYTEAALAANGIEIITGRKAEVTELTELELDQVSDTIRHNYSLIVNQ